MNDPPKPAEVIHLMEYLDTSPVTSARIKSWTEHDPILAKVKAMILTGWPAQTTSIEEELRPFVRRKDELSVEDGCVLSGNRVVVPSKGRSQVVQMLHEAQPGIARMKSLARGYVWWPGNRSTARALCQSLSTVSDQSETTTCSTITPMELAKQTLD